MRIAPHIRFLCLITVFIFACKHSSLKHIQGGILDENGVPLEGVSVILRYHLPSGVSKSNGPDNQYHYDSLTTDASGRYQFGIRKRAAWEHWLTIRHPLYKTDYIDLHNEKNPLDIKMYPK